MFLKLDMKFADDTGNPIQTCAIRKIHKAEGEAVEYGDARFDIVVTEIRLPSHLSLAWAQTRWLYQTPNAVVDLVAHRLEANGTALEKPKLPDPFFAAQVNLSMRVIALDRGIVCKMFAERGSVHRMG